MTSTTLTARTALCRVILAQNLVPTTTPSSTVHTGDTVINVTDVRMFRPESIISFWTASGSAYAGISGISPTGQMAASNPVPGTVTIDTPMPFGMATTDAVATNLVDSYPVPTSALIENGWPLIGVFSETRQDKYIANQRFQAQVPLRVVYEIQIVQPDNGMHPQLWTKQQEQRQENDMATLTDALTGNPTLSGTTIDIRSLERFPALRVEDGLIPTWHGELLATYILDQRTVSP